MYYLRWAATAQSVQQLSTGWTVWRSNPGGGEIFRTRPDRSWGPPSLLHNVYRLSYPGVQRLGRGFDHPTPPTVDVKERVQLDLYSPLHLRRLFQGEPLPLPFHLRYINISNNDDVVKYGQFIFYKLTNESIKLQIFLHTSKPKLFFPPMPPHVLSDFVVSPPPAVTEV